MALATLLAMPALGSASNRRALKRDLLPYAYIGPHLFFFIVFFVTPAIYGVYAAFTKWDLFNEPVFIGLENFRTMLFDSSNTYYRQLRNGLFNTIKFVIYSVPFCILVPLSLACALPVAAARQQVLSGAVLPAQPDVHHHGYADMALCVQPRLRYPE